MSINLRSIQTSSLNRKTVVIGILLTVGVLCVFFSPEIVAWKENATHRKNETLPKVSTPSRLARLAAGRTKQKEQPETATGPEPVPESVSMPVPKPPLGTPMPKDNGYRGTLESARDRAFLITRSLHPGLKEPRYAMLSFANGVDFILNHPTAIVTADEAVKYLEELRSRASLAMEAEEIDDALYKTWLAADFDTKAALAFVRSKIVPPFSSKLNDPRHPKNRGRVGEGGPITARRNLGSPQRGKKKGNQRYKVQSNYISVYIVNASYKEGTANLSFDGIIKGPDISRIEVFKNGIFVADITENRRIDGITPFKFKTEDGTGVFIIRVTNARGYSVEKRYQFLEGYADMVPL